jgi:hypothetical protein
MEWNPPLLIWAVSGGLAAFLLVWASVLYIRTTNELFSLLQREYPDQFPVTFPRGVWGGGPPARNTELAWSLEQLTLGFRWLHIPDVRCKRLLRAMRFYALLCLVTFLATFIALGIVFENLGI